MKVFKRMVVPADQIAAPVPAMNSVSDDVRRPPRTGRWQYLLAAILLLLAPAVDTIGLTTVSAQEIQATPITDDESPSFSPAAILTLSLDTETVNFGQLIPGGAMHLEDAVVVMVSGTAGATWQLTCSAAPTSAHTTSAPVESLSYAPADTSDWSSFQSTSQACWEEMSGDAVIGYDYLVHVPPTSTAGTFDVTVTYSVSTLE